MSKLVIVVDADMLVDLDVESIVVVQGAATGEVLEWWVEDVDYDGIIQEAILAGFSSEVEH